MNAGDVLFDRYRLEERIGAGGMGVVWRATDQLLEQPVALKQVRFGALDAEQAQLARARTLREARTAAALRGHRHVVATYEVRVEDGDAWLVLEYVPARSLGAVRDERGRLEITEVARIGAAVADALASAHARGIVHRDVTPNNVLIGADGTVKLTDFGLSRPLAPHPRLTQEGVLSGTVAYLAPEIAAGKAPSPAADVFSLGSTLYAALEGQPPFGTDPNSLRLLNVVRTGIIRPPTSAGAMTSLLVRLLELDPATRPDAATAAELLGQFAHRMTAATERLPADTQPPPGTARLAPDQPPLGTARLAPEELVPPPQRSHRARAVAMVLAVVAVVAAATFLGVRHLSGSARSAAAVPAGVPPTPAYVGPIGVPATPAHVGPVALTGDPAAADPCALLDPNWLRQFGYPQTVAPLLPHGCRAQITTGTGVVDYLEFDYLNLDPNLASRRSAQLLGGLSVIHPHVLPNQPECGAMIFLSDGQRVAIEAYGHDTTANLCRIDQVGTATAINSLARHGVTYTPGRTEQWPIARLNACALLTSDQVASLGGLSPTTAYPGFANWRCVWDKDTSVITVDLRLDTSQLSRNYGTPISLAGRQGWVYHVASSPPMCLVTVVARRAPTASDAVELVQVSDQAPATPQDNLCQRATALATAATTTALGHMPTG
jgi:hypothetical protein